MLGITANDDVSDLRQHGFYDSISEDSLKEVATYLVPQLYAAWIESSCLDHQRGYQIWHALNIYDQKMADIENYLVEDARYFYYFHLSQYDAPGDNNVIFTHYCNSIDNEPPRCFSLENRQFTDWQQRIKTKSIVKFVMDKGVPGYTFKGIYIADKINENSNLELKSI